MRAIKISTTIICLLFFIQLLPAAEKIICKNYKGTSGEFNFELTFTDNGKMMIGVDSKNGQGFFAVPGSYSIKNSEITFFYKGLSRTFYMEKDYIKASFYSFGISEELENKIILKETKSECK